MYNTKINLNPHWVTGFIDGEGSFYIRLSENKYNKSGWSTQACFQVGLHIKDKDLLLQSKSFFNETGNIYTNNNVVIYQVRSLNEIIQVIIPHFEKYSLITQKQSDFILFKKIVELMNKGEHLNKDGLTKIISLKASLNKGLPNKLKIYFPEVIEIDKPKVNFPIDINYNWIAGFFSGEGCFSVGISKATDCKIGYSVKLQIFLGQHSKDKLLMIHLVNILDCGNAYKYSNREYVELRVSKFEDINTKIIPFFKKYKIIGIKSLDFVDFCKVAELINKKAHLTLEGLEQIRKIKSKTNRSRIVSIN